MNPQSLRDPHAEAAVTDPAVELAREHRAAIDRLNNPSVEIMGAMFARIITVFERILGKEEMEEIFAADKGTAS